LLEGTLEHMKITVVLCYTKKWHSHLYVHLHPATYCVTSNKTEGYAFIRF